MQAVFALFSSPPAEAAPLAPEEFDALDDLLDELRSREEDIPQWEFCEGFLAALVCSRRSIPPAEYLPVLLGLPETEGETGASFKDEDQARAFAGLWGRRWAEVQAALDADVESLDDERCYHPELLDQRAAVQDLDEAERERFSLADLPSFAQVWALGFMYAVESWPEDWAPPRDKEAADALDSALGAIVALTEDDTGPAEVAPFGEGPATVSEDRVNDLADAIWAVYDLRTLWRGLGPRIATVRAEATPGRNDPCACGSGKKYKKCCGA